MSTKVSVVKVYDELSDTTESIAVVSTDIVVRYIVVVSKFYPNSRVFFESFELNALPPTVQRAMHELQEWSQ